MDLNLETTQISELRDLLRTTLGELSMEIANTDNAGYRRTLLERRDVLESIAAQISDSHLDD